jgi:hypothetical protein
MTKETDYERLKKQGAGYCHNCGAVITPDDLKSSPIRPAPPLHEPDLEESLQNLPSSMQELDREIDREINEDDGYRGY